MIQEIENSKNNIKKGSAKVFKFKTVQCLSKIYAPVYIHILHIFIIVWCFHIKNMHCIPPSFPHVGQIPRRLFIRKLFLQCLVLDKKKFCCDKTFGFVKNERSVKRKLI